MNDQHPGLEALERFLADELSEGESRALQRHIFTCTHCEERLVALLPGKSRKSTPDHRDLIRRVADDQRTATERRRADLAAERAAAADLWRELEPHDTARRRALIWEEPAYQTWGLFELLAQRSHEILPQEPRKAEDLARLALDVAEQLDGLAYGSGAVEAAKGRAWLHLANTLRVLGDFRQAEQAFQTAELFLARSWLDPLDEGLLLELKAPLRRAQGRFDEALAMLDEAVGIYREVNEPHLHGRVLMIKGVTLQYQGHPGKAAECFRQSLFLLDGTREPRLVVMSQCNLIGCLQDSGRSAEAAALIPEARRLVEQAGKRSDLLRLSWIGAKAAAALGRSADAERALLEIREAFLADDLAFDAAIVSLDLAALYARLGRPAEVKRLAMEMLPVFQSRAVYREALAALIVLQKAAEMEQLTLGLVEEVAAYLREAKNDPHLRFRGDPETRL